MRSATIPRCRREAGQHEMPISATIARMTNQDSPVRSGEYGAVSRGGGTWTFLTNHAHVLLTIARDPQSTLREVAAEVGITERATQKIVADLDAAGYLTRSRHGRRNRYSVTSGQPFRHPLAAGHDIDELLEILVPEAPTISTSEQ